MMTLDWIVVFRGLTEQAAPGAGALSSLDAPRFTLGPVFDVDSHVLKLQPGASSR